MTTVKMMRNRPVLNENLAVIVSFGFFTCLVLYFIVQTILPEPPEYIPPTIVVKNARPCVFQDDEWMAVEVYKVENEKYVCAELETNEDRNESELSFSFYEKDRTFLPIRVDSELFKQGQIAFLINHVHSPGNIQFTLIGPDGY